MLRVSSPLLVTAAAVGVLAVATTLFLAFRRKSAPSSAVSDAPKHCKQRSQSDGVCCGGSAAAGGQCCQAHSDVPVISIVYATTTGTARSYANQLRHKLASALHAAKLTAEVVVQDMAHYDQDNLDSEAFIVFLCSTWTDGEPPESARGFYLWLKDFAMDFRVSKSLLSNTRYAVFGFGHSSYDKAFCSWVFELDNMMAMLGAERMKDVGTGDEATGAEKKFNKWNKPVVLGILDVLRESQPATPEVPAVAPRKARPTPVAVKLEADDDEIKPDELEAEDQINEAYLLDDESDDEGNKEDDSGLVDVEELGTMFRKQSKQTSAVASNKSETKNEMVTKMQRKALTKEGYKIIGSHSAVKLCRWTKHQLRGRGGCYKHTFYGITSYQCMETTPSLACANKCVFCWRHHKNPVGKEWRWKTDEPDMIVREAIELHQAMINEARGIPGVKPERWQEAFTVKHCALSLVGEPIMYPRINELVRELHNRQISSFLVTNAQFPESISTLDPVTQLYISIDAATKDSLKAVDRPLFRDFWERFLASLRFLAEKKQRTVYRLTLVQGWNMQEVEDYVSLLNIGDPDFIEIKAVTYCGKSDASSLTMENVPWHKDVCNFAEMIAEKAPNYALAAAHEHSCCVLLAKKDFFIDGQWHTWIDYPKFHQLMQDYYANGTEFTALDYTAPTPSWAVYGAEERGFDPVEERFRRNKAGQVVEDEYKPSESGCG